MPRQTIGYLSLEKGSIHHVYVTYFQSPAKFWIQLAANVEILDDIHEGIVTELQTIGPRTLDRVESGVLCVAKYTAAGENSYYRALVRRVSSSNECRVSFIDYGNTSTVNISEVMVLNSRFSSLGAQAIECSLSGASSHTADLDSLLECEHLYVKVLSVTDDCLHIVDLSTSPDNFMSVPFNSEGQATILPSGSAAASSSFSPVQFNMGKFADVCISYVEDDGFFYCQLMENADKLDELMCDLQLSYGPDSAYITQPKPGIPCIVFDRNEQIHYRAQVLSIRGNNNEVRYIDFGMPSFVPVSCLRQISEEHMLLPVQAIGCTLANSEDIPAQLVTQLLQSRRRLMAKVQLKTIKGYEMELVDTSSGDDIYLVTMLKDSLEGIALSSPMQGSPPVSSTSKKSVQPAEVRLHSDEKLYVASVLSDTTFFGQLSKYPADTIDDFQDQLAAFYSVDREYLQNPSVDDVCCSQFSEDGGFYRAQIASIQGNMALVRFLDYGNEEQKNLDELYALHTKFHSLPQRGVLCSLTGSYTGLTKEELGGILLETKPMVHFDAKQGHFFKVTIPENAENTAIASQLARYKVNSRSPSQSSLASSTQHR